MTKMNFVYYCADDMLNGTMTLSIEEELAYRRIVDLIYSTGNKLEDNGRMAWMTKLGDQWEQTRNKLVEKKKIQLEKGYIRVERCTDEINKALVNYHKKQKAANTRWNNANEDAHADAHEDAHAHANAYANHKPLTINHKLNNRKLWEDEESLTPITFAKKYNISGKFVKFENEMYYFEEKDTFGMMTWTYNKVGKMIPHGKRQKGKT